ncbi:uncharacterized protein LOC117925600 [Vitis riparia]|uniref:uncharacterized protein LOC117925600 n=1 Tax=Vitis riparia TaxID=96939 RepID=UPI00155A4ED1|nr:uncharacterized protein LOC117925600 [Vitis riparia]
MGGTAKQSFDDLGFKGIDANGNHQHNQWLIMGGADDNSDTISMESSSFEDSENSLESSSSLDLTEDASSSTSPLSNGPLYELSELMAQLPIKRGLSKYFQGKSQSFTSLASVKSLEDLAKKGTPNRKKMKSCKSYGGGLDVHKLYTPKATISKKASRGSLLSSLGRRGVIMGSCRPPSPLQKNF